MALLQPTSLGECVYFTNRTMGTGSVRAWVLREKCPKCHEGLMGKPRDEKGKVKIRAKEYVCPKCNHVIPEDEYEKTLTANIKYKCPHCSHDDEIQIPFIRKKIKTLDEEEMKEKTADALRFQCSKCGKNIDVTKKMK